MFGNFYNSNIRNYIVLMGQLFNGIQIKRIRRDGTRFIKVPIVYSNKEKFMMTINQKTNDINNHDPDQPAKVETILPRMRLSLVEMLYDAPRATDYRNNSEVRNNGRLYNPVPYKFIFELGVHTRYIDDMFQIIEQILPYFRPQFQVKLVEQKHDSDNDIKIENRNIPITLINILPDDSIDSDVQQRRFLEYSIMFELQGWIYPPEENQKGIIKTIYLDFYANERDMVNVDDSFESVDTQVIPLDGDQDNWDGSYEQSFSHDIPMPKDPQPSKVRKNKK